VIGTSGEARIESEPSVVAEKRILGGLLREDPLGDPRHEDDAERRPRACAGVPTNTRP
jgi:hypothetical protein